jgi:hypothetical protein
MIDKADVELENRQGSKQIELRFVLPLQARPEGVCRK